MRDRVATILDRAAAQRDVEFNEGVARQLPGAVILRLLGMSESYLERLKAWTDGVTRALTSFDPKTEWLDAIEVVVTEMAEIFTREIEDRRKNPGSDFITALVTAADGNDTLTVDEMIGALILIIVAGHDTTSNSMTLGVRALDRHPAAWAEMRAHPERSVDSAVELMRYSAMSAGQPRLAAQDFEWRGRKIRKHDIVMLFIAGGNRDPKVFPNPEKLDLTRANDQSQTFAPGLHHCIGHLLAKLQLGEFFAALTQRFDRVEILEDPEFTPNLVFRGVAGSTSGSTRARAEAVEPTRGIAGGRPACGAAMFRCAPEVRSQASQGEAPDAARRRHDAQRHLRRPGSDRAHARR